MQRVEIQGSPCARGSAAELLLNLRSAEGEGCVSALSVRTLEGLRCLPHAGWQLPGSLL